MANICNYEIHVRGNKKASLYLYTMIPALDYKEIIHEFGTIPYTSKVTVNGL